MPAAWTLPDTPAVAGCRRVLVMGCNGAGKTTFARRLGAVLDIEVVHLDSLLIRPGWKLAPQQEFARAQEPLVRRPSWIIDGNCLSTFDVRAPFADLVIVFNLPAAVCLVRVVRRTMRSLRHPRPDLADGCRERLDSTYIKFLWRVCTFRRRFMPRLERCLERLPEGTPIIRLRSSRAAATLLQRLEPTASVSASPRRAPPRPAS